MLRRLVHWLQPIFLLLALVAIGWFLAQQWPALRTYPWRLNWSWLLLTALLTVASWAVEIAIWWRLLAALGGQLSYWTAVRIWFLSAIVRYIPGNIWQPLSLTLYCRRHGVAPEASLTSIALYQVVILLAIVPIFVVYFAWIDTRSLAAQLVAYFPRASLWVTLIPVVAFVLRPTWLERLLNWALARLHRPPLPIHITTSMLLTLTLAALADWLLWGAVFAAFTFAFAGSSVQGSEVALAPLLIASYPIATIVGLLSFITPSGFGVREGAFYLLLSPYIAGSVVTVLAIGLRVWGIVSELVAALISLPFERASMATQANTTDYAADYAVELAGPIDLPYHEPVVAPDLRRESL
jgi:uncharacterized membrane protein YbhN (UPF0104 family)